MTNTRPSSGKELNAPIIFFGAPRSGTSIISEVVTRHKDIGYATQYQNIFKTSTSINLARRLFDNRLWRIHGSRKQLNDVNFLNRLAPRHGENYPMWEKIVGEDIDFSRDFLIDQTADKKKAREIRQFFLKIIKNQGKARLALKITGPPRLTYINSLFPDAKLVFIGRDPTSIISSLLRADFWNDLGRNKLWWTGAYSSEECELAQQHADDPVWMTGFQILKIMQITEQQIGVSENEVLRVAYGDFVEQPEQTVTEILNFADLERDSACFDYFAQNKIHNQDRKSRDYFSEEQLNTISRLFGSGT